MKFGAVYCLYDDHEYLEVSLESIENKLDKVLFLMSDIPWNGKKSDNSSTIQKVKNLCKNKKNFELIQGHWTNEIDQRNFGLTKFYKEGIDYCFVIDSDEIYYESHFENIKQFILQNPSVVAFHLEWNTYWSKKYYVISPREYYKPVIAVKVDSFQFTTIRHGITSISRSGDFVFQTKEVSYNGIVIPPQIAICFHLSYARSNEYMKRKLETNSHAPEFIKNWYEDVWLKWTPSSKNLHPVTPQQYNQAIKENFVIFPQSLKKLIKKEVSETSIIILNWNSCDLLKKCVELVVQNTNFYELIIVDNGSTKDDSLDVIKSLQDRFKFVKTVFNKENLGFAQGVNEGIKAAKSENNICLLNVDAEPQKGWLEEMLSTLNSIPNCGIVGPLGNNVENGYQKEKMVEKDTQVFNLHFYCCLIFRQVIERIGMFDPQFGIGGYEDNDFCIRANLSGFQCWISSKSLVKHQPHQVFKLNNIDNFEVEAKNKQILQEKLISAFYEYAKVVDLYSINEIAKKTKLVV